MGVLNVLTGRKNLNINKLEEQYMTNFEKSIKRTMTCEKFNKIRNHVYGDKENTFEYTYGDVASWLTWNRDENGQIASVEPPTPEYTKGRHIFDGPIADWEKNKLPGFASKLTTDIVFVGLNMSGNGKPFVDSAGNKWPKFQNARGHKRIINTFFNTAAEGAYFTDIIKPDKRFLDKLGNPANSKEVKKIISKRPDVLKEHIQIFKDELDYIGAVKPLLIVLEDIKNISPGDISWILEQEGFGKKFLDERFHAVVKITHYAGYPKGGDEGYKNDIRQKLAPYITIPKSMPANLRESENKKTMIKSISTTKKDKSSTNTPTYTGDKKSIAMQFKSILEKEYKEIKYTIIKDNDNDFCFVTKKMEAFFKPGSQGTGTGKLGRKYCYQVKRGTLYLLLLPFEQNISTLDKMSKIAGEPVTTKQQWKSVKIKKLINCDNEIRAAIDLLLKGENNIVNNRFDCCFSDTV